MQHIDPLQTLGLRDINPGTWSGSHGWSEQTDGPLIESINPATGKRLAQVRGATRAGLRACHGRGGRGGGRMAPGAGAEARRSGASHGRGIAQVQGCARQPRVPGKRQDQSRGRRRSAGDDRHRRFRGRAIAHAVRPHHAFGTAATPHVRAMASARRGRRDFRLQFSGRRLVLERVPGGDQRQCHGVETLAEDRSVLPRRAAHLQSSAGASLSAADLPDLHRRRHGARDALRR